MRKSISPTDLGAAIEKELTIYHQDVLDAMNAAGDKAVTSLVKKTRATAPKGARGSFKKSIAKEEIKGKRGNTYVWYVKPPDHRLTHLLVHGHATKDGGRTKADPFLENALADVMPEYENDVKEALQNGK